MNEVVSLLAYFMVYAFIGWVLESTYKSILQEISCFVQKHLRNQPCSHLH